MVAKAYIRISNHIHNTPLLYSETLNKMIGSDVYFKMDAMQKTGSFKLRGVLNSLGWSGIYFEVESGGANRIAHKCFHYSLAYDMLFRFRSFFSWFFAYT